MQSPVALRPLAPPACFESPEAYTRAVYSARMSATAHGRNPHFLQRSANRRRGGKIVLFSRHDVSDRFRKPRPPHLRQATAIARGHGDTGRLRPSFRQMRLGPLPSTCLFRYAFRSCGSRSGFGSPSRSFRTLTPPAEGVCFSARLSKLPRCDSRRGLTGSARFLPHDSAKLIVMYTAMGLPLHAEFPLRRRIRPCRYPSPW